MLKLNVLFHVDLINSRCDKVEGCVDVSSKNGTIVITTSGKKYKSHKCYYPSIPSFKVIVKLPVLKTMWMRCKY